MKKEPLRLLFVEDLEDDVLLAEELLRREGLSFESRTVFSLEDLEKALPEFRPHLVISDYNLPGFTALEVLFRVRAFDPEVGFIVFTGSIGEERAIECLKAGADDYVLKGHLRRLPHAVKEVLRKKSLERDHREALEKLRLSEERYRYITHTVSDYAYAFVVDEEGRMRGEWISESFYRVFGLTLQEVIARGGWEAIVHPEDLPRAREHARRVLSGSPDTCVFRMMTREGRVRWLKDYAVPVRDPESGRVVRIYGASQDITELVEKEEALRRLAERLQHYTSLSPAVIYVLRREGEVWQPVWVSENLVKKLGYALEEVLRPEWWPSVLHPEDREEALAKQEILMREGHLIHEYRLRAKDGRYLWVRDEVRLIRDAEGRPLEAVGAWVDITAEKEIERALEDQREMLEALLEGSPSGIIFFDPEGRIQYANRAFCEMLGWSPEEIRGRLCTELGCEQYDLSGRPLPERPIRMVVSQARPLQFFQFRVKNRQGRELFLSLNAVPLHWPDGRLRGVLGIFTDITEHKRLEEQYLRAQKLEAVGRLTGGIAHDFNNILSVILGYADLLLSRIPEGDPLRGPVEHIYQTAQRARGVIQKLLLFTRRGPSAPEPLDLGALVEELLEMIRRAVGERVEVVFHRDEGPLPVKLDRAQIEQVLLNLVVNAREAMPQGGRLTIEVRRVELTEAYAEKQYEMPPGRYILLVVSDTGVGMTEEVKEHIFEPFFTTKPEGTGLGLSTVYGVVKGHGGHIHVYSEPGKGTAFKIYFPEAEAVAEARAREEKAPDRGRGETIAVVEDEEEVRGLLETALTEAGYRVKSFGNPREALEFLSRESVDLLLTDLIMPEMTGRELVEELARRGRKTRVLFMSGYTEDILAREKVRQGEVEFLGKPFTLRELLRRVRQVLER